MPDAHEVSTPFQINLQLENWVETTCNDDLWLAEEKMCPDKAGTILPIPLIWSPGTSMHNALDDSVLFFLVRSQNNLKVRKNI